MKGVPGIVLLLVLLVATGCGPVAIGVGLSEVFKDDPPPDKLQPALNDVQVATVDGAENAGEYLNADSFDFEISANKPLAFRATLLGPDDEDVAVDVRRISNTRARISSAEVLRDGEYRLEIEGQDTEKRTAKKTFDFLVDKKAPRRPVLFDAATDGLRSIKVRWIPFEDRESDDNDDAAPSGVAGFNIYVEAGPNRVMTRTQVRASTEFRIPMDIPIFVAGGLESEYEIEGLPAGRSYRLQITAVDKAGNESGPAIDAEEIGHVRTRAGGDGEFPAEFRTRLDLPGDETVDKTVREIEVADLDADGTDDLVVVTGPTIYVYRGTGEVDGRAGFELRHQLVGVNDEDPGFVAVEVLDIGGNNILDLFAVGSGTRDRLYVWRGGGASGRADGELPEADRGAYTLPGKPTALAGGDLEPDGVPEVAVTTSNGVYVYTFAAGGTPDLVGDAPFTPFAGGSAVVLAPQDDDADLDLVVAIGAELRAVRGPEYLTQETFQTTVSAGGVVNGLVVGDLDGDPYPDLVAAHDTGTIGIVLGAPPADDQSNLPGLPGSQAGLIRFREPIVFEAGLSIAKAVIADFDSDRVNDIAVVSFAGGLRIQFGVAGPDGAPSLQFASGAPVTLAGAPTEIATGDFNGDGIPDIVLGDPGGVVEVLLGAGANMRGDGTFAPPQGIGVGGNDGLTIEHAGDVDQDGIPDLVGLFQGGALLRVFQGRGASGQGNARFDFGRSAFAHRAWKNAAVGDFDLDGRADFAGYAPDSVAGSTGYVEMQLSRDSGFVRTFGWIDGFVDDEPHPLPRPIAFDANGDGHLDLLLSRRGDPALLLGPLESLPGPNAGELEKLASGGIAVRRAAALQLEAFNARGLAVADMDGNRQVDLVGFDPGNGALRVSLQRSEFERIGIGPAGKGLEGLESGSVVFSGLEFPLTNNSLSFRLNARINSADGLAADAAVDVMVAFFVPRGLPTQFTAQNFFGSENAKRSNDETVYDSNTGATVPWWDYFVINFYGAAATFAWEEGATELEAKLEVPNYNQPFLVVVRNRTGVPLTTDAEDPSTLRADRFEFLGTKNTSIPGFSAALAPSHRFTDALATADFDGDGLVDLVALHPDLRKAAVLMGNGDGSFLAFEDPSAPQPGVTLSRVVDLDDIVFEGGATAQGKPLGIRIADLNGDGIPDLVAVTDANEVATLLGSRTGEFTPKQLQVLTSAPGEIGTTIGDINSMAIADVNGDTVPDLVLGTTGQPVVLLGNGAGTRDEAADEEWQDPADVGGPFTPADE